MSETITADHLNATHLGKKISILDNCEIVMSGKLKELRATQYSMPVYSNILRLFWTAEHFGSIGQVG